MHPKIRQVSRLWSPILFWGCPQHCHGKLKKYTQQQQKDKLALINLTPFSEYQKKDSRGKQ